MDFMRAWRVVRARKTAVALVAIVCFSLVLAAPKPKSDYIPIYTSKSKVLITPPSSSVRAYGGQSAAASVDFSWFADPTVLTELLRSEELLTRVVNQAQTNVDPQTLGYAISVEPLSEHRYGRNIRLFNLSVQNSDPVEAQKLTRLVTSEFVKYVEDLSAREFATTRRFIEELVLEAEGRRDAVETSLMTVREKYLGVLSDQDLRAKINGLEGRLNENERELSAVQAEVSSLTEYLQGSSNNPPWDVLSGDRGSLSALDSNVAEKRLELSRLQDIYTEQNENVVRAKRELESSERLYNSALRESASSLHKSKSAQLTQFQGVRTSLVAEINGLLRSRMSEEDRRQVSKLERELQVWEQNHLNLQQQLYQARVVEQSSRRSGAVNVLEQPGVGVLAADAKKAPVDQSTVKRSLMSIPFCLILGIAAAFVQEYLSSSTKLRPRIEEALELPVLAVIPATPSELTVDWESFKRPGQKESIQPLVLASHRASGFEERQGSASSEARVGAESADGDAGSSFGGNFRFRNQK